MAIHTNAIQIALSFQAFFVLLLQAKLLVQNFNMSRETMSLHIFLRKYCRFEENIVAMHI